MASYTLNVNGRPVELRLCEAHTHRATGPEPRLAVKRVWWVTGPVEYCGECAAQMIVIAEALGYAVKAEPIPLPYVFTDEERRAIDLKGA